MKTFSSSVETILTILFFTGVSGLVESRREVEVSHFALCEALVPPLFREEGTERVTPWERKTVVLGVSLPCPTSHPL